MDKMQNLRDTTHDNSIFVEYAVSSALHDIFRNESSQNEISNAVDISIAGALHYKYNQDGEVMVETMLKLAEWEPQKFVDILQEAVKRNEFDVMNAVCKDDLVVGDPFTKGGELLIAVPGKAQVIHSTNLVISHHGLGVTEKVHLAAVASDSTSGAVEKKGTAFPKIESGSVNQLNRRAPLLSTPDIPASDTNTWSFHNEPGKAQKYSVAMKSRTHPYRNMKKSLSTSKDANNNYKVYRDHQSLSELMECCTSSSFLYRDKPSKRVINRSVLVEQTPLMDTPFATTLLKRCNIEEARNILGQSSSIQVDDSWEDLFFTVDDVENFVEKSQLAKELDRAMDELPVVDCPLWL